MHFDFPLHSTLDLGHVWTFRLSQLQGSSRQMTTEAEQNNLWELGSGRNCTQKDYPMDKNTANPATRRPDEPPAYIPPSAVPASRFSRHWREYGEHAAWLLHCAGLLLAAVQ
jgi:hypothetical protein